jgi:precorrin-3B synthase
VPQLAPPSPFPEPGLPPALDACPGLLALHPGRDGLVARIRIPGGYLTATRLRSLAVVADAFAGGRLDVTARANVQLRGIAAGDAAGLAVSATAHGLLPSRAHDRARNIVANPLAGLGGRRSVRSLVQRLDLALRRDAALAVLPGRFLFALDSDEEPVGSIPRGEGLAGCDLGLRVGPRGAAMIVAGRETGILVPLGREAPSLWQAARRAVVAGIGSDVQRIADLPDAGGAIVAELGGSPGASVFAAPARLPLGADGAVAVVAAPLGRVTSRQLRLLARNLVPGEVVRLAAAGRIVVPTKTPDQALARLGAAGLLVSDEQSLAGVTACSGLSCARSLGDVRSWAAPVRGHQAVHWAGCERGCGRPADAVGIVAVDEARVRVAGAAEIDNVGELFTRHGRQQVAS